MELKKKLHSFFSHIKKGVIFAEILAEDPALASLEMIICAIPVWRDSQRKKPHQMPQHPRKFFLKWLKKHCRNLNEQILHSRKLVQAHHFMY